MHLWTRKHFIMNKHTTRTEQCHITPTRFQLVRGFLFFANSLNTPHDFQHQSYLHVRECLRSSSQESGRITPLNNLGGSDPRPSSCSEDQRHTSVGSERTSRFRPGPSQGRVMVPFSGRHSQVFCARSGLAERLTATGLTSYFSDLNYSKQSEKCPYGVKRICPQSNSKAGFTRVNNV